MRNLGRVTSITLLFSSSNPMACSKHDFQEILGTLQNIICDAAFPPMNNVSWHFSLDQISADHSGLFWWFQDCQQVCPSHIAHFFTFHSMLAHHIWMAQSSPPCLQHLVLTCVDSSHWTSHATSTVGHFHLHSITQFPMQTMNGNSYFGKFCAQ